MIMKRKRGAPRVLERVYGPWMCDRVIAVGKRGGSRNAMALACGVYPRVMRKWTRRHPEFSLAYEMAKQKAQVYWERLGAAHIADASFNHSVWLHIMQRFEQPDRHLRFRRQHRPSSVTDVAAMMITRVVTRSRSGDAP